MKGEKENGWGVVASAAGDVVHQANGAPGRAHVMEANVKLASPMMLSMSASTVIFSPVER